MYHQEYSIDLEQSRVGTNPDGPATPAPTPTSDPLSVDNLYQRYGHHYEREPEFGREETFANIVANPNDPNFDLERLFRATAAQHEKDGWAAHAQTVTFQNLTVTVPQNETHIPTYSTTLTHLFTRPYTQIRDPAPPFQKLTDLNGYCRPGEMLLVMGPPGSGCSTLLKCLSGRRSNYSVTGNILYNGNADYKNLTLSLVGEEDTHLPYFTVEQTLRFAYDMLMPPDFPNKEDGRYVDNVLQLLGLYRCKDTVVGDAMLRGISGGEKKRVTIGEMLMSRASVLCFDGWSRGLDAAAAVDICKIMRLVANTLRKTIIMSQYQASPEMFEIFDNLLLLDAGRQVYFGPIKGAIPYFEKLGLRCPPRRTIPDFLATVVDRVAEVTIPGANPPQNPEQFARSFIESEEFLGVYKEIESCNLSPPEASHQAPEAKVAFEQKYATTFKYQLKRLVKREFMVFKQATQQLVYPRIGQNVFMGLVLGLLFLRLDTTEKGSYSKTGCLFQALTNVSFSSFSFMPALLLARNVFYKHKDARFFHPMAWFLSKTVSDLPFTILDTLIFGSLVYWMVGFYSDAARFGFFLLVLWTTNVCMSNLVRAIGCMTPDLSAAQGLVAAVFMFFIFFCGFMIPLRSLPAFWKWAYWISPVRYPLHALLLNEFMPTMLHCTPSELKPSLAQLATVGVNASEAGKYQICTIPGYPTGPRTGKGYLMASYGIEDKEGLKWMDVLAIVGFTFLFLLLAAFAVHKFNFAPASSNLRYKRKKRPALPSTSTAATEPAYPFSPGSVPTSPLELTVQISGAGVSDYGHCREAVVAWTDLAYEVPKPKVKKGDEGGMLRLLDGITGYCGPRNMIALMGSSGAGKTTLLDVLAMRKTGGKITGGVTINGKPQDRTFNRFSGYVEQEDTHQPMATVREALRFAARLRLPPDSGEEKIAATVESTLQQLGLNSLADAMIGSDMTGGGIPLEARKRLTIGVELVANPSIIFMDEPTSGLDTRGALKVMKAARRIADSGRAVICTIHQPSAELFELFDSLLLLARGGKTVYFGPIGANSETLLAYFERHGAPPCAEHYNPADYILDVIGSGLNRKSDGTDWPELWRNSEEMRRLNGGLMLANLGSDLPPPFEATSKDSLLPPMGTQIRALTGRSFKVFWRTPSYNLLRHIFALCMALLLGSSYFQLGDTQSDLQGYVSSLFYTIFLGALGMMNAMIPVFTERAVFSREIANGSYSRTMYAVVIGLVEVPFIAGASVLFMNVFYWMVGLPPSNFGFAFIDFFAFQAFCVFLGQALAAIAPTLQVALGVAPMLMSFWILHLGFLIPKTEIPNYFIEFYIVNPYKYYMRSFVASALTGKTFRCTTSQYLELPRPPLGCPTTPANQWLDAGTACKLCPQVSGDEYLKFYSWSASTKWTDFIIVLAACLAFRLITAFAMAKRQYTTR
eukprot:TRINITY_DN0_c1_g1_i1.p1 TRINITY_DN0_c1_g1~~TRINITY_DN0_c1_g1_i1.p1  ORF type:complete len:1430 (-),score=273.60 TRINITY_DN0_c1_g1_i1:211-4500(-)